VVHHGLEERRTPGNTLAVQPDQPYRGLTALGTGFLSRFEGSQCPAALLEQLSIIDTPGVLSGEKQRIDRQYSFIDACEWFSARADMILLLFDPFKLVGGVGGCFCTDWAFRSQLPLLPILHPQYSHQ